MDTLEQLIEAVETGFEQLKDLEPGSESYEKHVNALTKLIGMGVEIEKTDMNAEEQTKSREAEIELKKQQLEVEKRDKFINNCISAGKVISGIGLSVWGTLKILKFEETGSITTNPGRKYVDSLFTFLRR